MSERWYTVNETGHVPFIAAELPPGRVLIDETTGQMIDHDWEVIEEVEVVVHERKKQPPKEEVQEQPVEEQTS